MGESTQPIDGRQLIQEAKDKVNKTHKEENKMKKAVITSVVLTIATIAAFAFMFYLGVQYEKGINNRVQQEAKTLVSNTTPTSK